MLLDLAIEGRTRKVIVQATQVASETTEWGSR
jgi:hypothetical protein